MACELGRGRVLAGRVDAVGARLPGGGRLALRALVRGREDERRVQRARPARTTLARRRGRRLHRTGRRRHVHARGLARAGGAVCAGRARPHARVRPRLAAAAGALPPQRRARRSVRSRVGRVAAVSSSSHGKGGAGCRPTPPTTPPSPLPPEPCPVKVSRSPQLCGSRRRSGSLCLSWRWREGRPLPRWPRASRTREPRCSCRVTASRNRRRRLCS